MTAQVDRIIKHISQGIMRHAEIHVRVGMELFLTGYTFSATVMEKLGEEMESNKGRQTM